jgi:hypothetical protein
MVKVDGQHAWHCHQGIFFALNFKGPCALVECGKKKMTFLKEIWYPNPSTFDQ